MAQHLCLSIRMLRPEFHGRGDGGLPEWPPSPLRAFQFLLAGAASRDRRVGEAAQEALLWLEASNPPTVIAPRATPPASDAGYRLSVPNNAMDVVARAWSRGSTSGAGDSNPATHRTMKRVLPVRLLTNDPIRYVWDLGDAATTNLGTFAGMLDSMARAASCFGWGLDHAVAAVEVLSSEAVATLAGERWFPGEVAEERGLRVPVPETLTDLLSRHERFVTRIGADGVLTPPPPLTAFAVVEYRRAEDPVPSPFAAFELRRLDDSGFAGFDPTRRGLTLSGMLRHAVRQAAESSGWSSAKVAAFVLGHGEPHDEGHRPVGGRRFVYLPIPSIEFRGAGRGAVVGALRRVLVACPGPSGRPEVAWARRALAGQELLPEGGGPAVAVLRPIASTDRSLARFTQPSSEWATVTPVVLPGHDDPGGVRRKLAESPSPEAQRRLLGKLSRRTDALLRKALAQAGLPVDLVRHADLEWRSTGFLPGVEMASKYGVPDHLSKLPRVHVRLGWRDRSGRPVRVPGPLVAGGGRFNGLGLFAGIAPAPRAAGK